MLRKRFSTGNYPSPHSGVERIGGIYWNLIHIIRGQSRSLVDIGNSLAVGVHPEWMVLIRILKTKEIIRISIPYVGLLVAKGMR